MDAERKVVADVEFWRVGALQLGRTATGELVEYVHDLDPGTQPNKYSAGPFCSFSLPHAPRASGVYAIFVAGDLKYIGECEDLLARFSAAGYGRISPRNCHSDGQSTNCKLNSRILAEAKLGNETEIWFSPTLEYKALEARLIALLNPPWNGRIVSTDRREMPERRDATTTPVRTPRASTRNGGMSTDTFRQALRERLMEAEAEGLPRIAIRAGDLHRAVGDYPGPNHRMPMCCSAMRSLMQPGDRLLFEPPKGNGANLEVEYSLPRVALSR
jgi:hypothetical protein